MTMKKLSEDNKQRLAPDGGWGWLVCFGSSLISLSLRSLDPSFGLLFQDLLEDLQVGSTGTSLIMSVLEAIVNFSGLIVGPLLKKYSYRTVAVVGSLISCLGLILTSRASSMLHIICTYSILGGLGTGLAIASSFVALNTVFDKKRGQAVGFSMAGTSVAMMLVPQLVHILLELYGFRGTMLIIGACALHSVVGAYMLRPLETKKSKSSNKVTKEPREDEALLNGKNNGIKMKLTSEVTAEPSTDKQCAKEYVGDNLEKEEGVSWTSKLNKILDLDLLKNAVYVNVIVGASLYCVAELNFKLMTPFFLSDIGMTNAEIAFCLSITAFTDILARLTLPTLFDKLGYTKRMVFWITSLLLGFGRSVLAETRKGTALTAVFVVIGFLRGATLVNLNLTVSECVPLKKLPNAFGIFMVFKGISVVVTSTLLGYIRDYSNSYKICIHVMTGMIVITFATWGIEYLCEAFYKRKHASTKKTHRESLA